jgi:serine/threonine-protein kinase
VARRSAETAAQLYVRRLDRDLQAVALPGTEGAIEPFFSPGGESIAFFADAKLKKIAVTGGAVVPICNASTSARGGTWAEDDTIVFSPDTRTGSTLQRVRSTGGQPQALTTLGEGEITQRWPQMLPGGRAVLYTGHSLGRQFDEANLVVQSLPSGKATVVKRGAYFGRYVPSGHLLYIHEGTLFAVPFNPDRPEEAGPSISVQTGVASLPRSGGAQYAVASNGTLVYGPAPGDSAGTPIEWLNRDGKTTVLRATPSQWTSPRFSADGKRLALQINDGSQPDIFVLQLGSGNLVKVTADSATHTRPVWLGNGLVFASRPFGATGTSLYWKSPNDKGGEAVRLTEGKTFKYATSWNSGDRVLAFEEQNPQTKWDLMILPMEGDDAAGWKPGKPIAFLNGAASERTPMFSPDGRWIAYVSDESGRDEVYVRPYPGPGKERNVSTDGGEAPLWSPIKNRNEIFYSQGGQIMVATFAVNGGAFSPQKPRLWSLASGVVTSRGFDADPNGDRFAVGPVPRAIVDARPDSVVFVFNFFEELRRIVPGK